MSRPSSAGRRRRTFVVIAVVALIAVVGLVQVLKLWNRSRAIVAYSCVASIQAALDKRGSAAFTAEGGDSWSVLADRETEALLKVVGGSEGFDCGAHKVGEAALDPWGHRIVVKVRRSLVARVEFDARSGGPDEILDTADDIVVWPDR